VATLSATGKTPRSKFPVCGVVASTGAVRAIKPEATDIFAPQDGRWKNNRII